MSKNKNAYDDPHIAEIYDKTEAYVDDIELIRSRINNLGAMHILEPFCGTGRIIIPLACDGHRLVGIDESSAMLNRAQSKLNKLSDDIKTRVKLIQADATAYSWPEGFDLVILGANCLYELATPEEQETCIAKAAASLKPGGYLFLDNNHMEGELDESWRQTGPRKSIFPVGTCDDGTCLDATTETTWFDGPKRLWQARRLITIKYPDGTNSTIEQVVQKHPVSVVEQQQWLRTYGFIIENLYGDRKGSPYTDKSDRAIFWAKKA